MKSFLAKTWQAMPLSKHIQLAIMRLTQDEFLIGVTGVILNDKNEVLVVNHSYRDGKHWSLPGGYIKGREHPKEGLAREVEEETGFIVRALEEVRIRTDREAARIDISLIGKHIGGQFRASDEVTEAAYFEFEKLPLLSQNQLMLIKEVLERGLEVKKDLSNPVTKKEGFREKLSGFLKRYM